MSDDAPAFSPEALTARYRAERDKRLALRPEGLAQYVEVAGAFADFYTDPFVEPGFTRDPVVEEIDVLVVGAGLGGLSTAARLAQRGIRDIRIVDKAGDFGGTWYWNRYPGAACDVESYIYLPFLEETGYVPAERYAGAPEIFAHCQRVARHFDLYPSALFQTELTELRWDGAASRWIASTNREDRLAARFVVIAGGIMHKPKLPGIPGLERFQGRSFHTTRWNYTVTGGSPTAPMDALRDKRVGIVGTGATAVQAVPKLAEAAGHLYVFQRTPSSVAPRDNRPTDPAWAATLRPGWQQERLENFTSLTAGEPWEVDLVQDGWTEMFRNNRGAGQTPQEREMDDFRDMEELRARIDRIVPDKVTADALKPWYSRWCKRPCFHDEYLAAFARPNVTLVDTAGKGIERMTEAGPVVDGVEYPLDVLIYSTGFEMGTAPKSRLGFDIHGRDGLAHSADFAAGPHSLHGVLTRGFPNLLTFSTTQGGFAINFAHVLFELAIHVAAVIRRAIDEGRDTIEPTAEAEDAWLEEVIRHAAAAGASADCTPGYLNGEGAKSDDPAMLRHLVYFGGPARYFGFLRDWREAPVLADLA